MPSNFRSLTNTSREENMVQEPNLDTFVVCRATEDVGRVQIGEVSPTNWFVFVSVVEGLSSNQQLDWRGGVSADWWLHVD